MAMTFSPRSSYPMRCATADCYIVILRCEANNTSAPDGADPDVGTWGYTSEGLLSYTFPEKMKPARMLFGVGNFEESDVNGDVKPYSYTSSTGVLLVTTTYDDGTSGVPEIQNFTDKTLTLMLVCSDSSLNAA